MKRKPKIIRGVRWSTDKGKIKFYTENETHHKQKIIEGIRLDGSRYKIICDWKIIDLIRDLNNMGVRTVWSCQGNALGCPSAYVVINPSKLSKRKLIWADNYIRNYWHDRYIQVEIGCEGNICFHAYTKEQLYAIDHNMLCTSIDDKL